MQKRWQLNPPDGLSEDRALGLAEAGPDLPAAGSMLADVPAQLPAHVANPGDGDFQRAALIQARMPDALASAARSHDQVVALVLALLHSPDAAIAERQRALVAGHLGAGIADACARHQVALADLHPLLRLPLAQLAFPALRRRPRPALDVLARKS